MGLQVDGLSAGPGVQARCSVPARPLGRSPGRSGRLAGLPNRADRPARPPGRSAAGRSACHWLSVVQSARLGRSARSDRAGSLARSPALMLGHSPGR